MALADKAQAQQEDEPGHDGQSTGRGLQNRPNRHDGPSGEPWDGESVSNYFQGRYGGALDHQRSGDG